MSPRFLKFNELCSVRHVRFQFDCTREQHNDPETSHPWTFFGVLLSSLGFFWLSHPRGGRGGRTVNLPQAKRNHSDLFSRERDGGCLVSGLRGPNPHTSPSVPWQWAPPHSNLCSLASNAAGLGRYKLPSVWCWHGRVLCAQAGWRALPPAHWHPSRSAPCWCPASPPPAQCQLSANLGRSLPTLGWGIIPFVDNQLLDLRHHLGSKKWHEAPKCPTAVDVCEETK